MLRPRNQADVYWPTDATPPTVTITDPPGVDIHMASGQTSVQLAGTATDAQSGVASVKVGFTDAGADPQTEPTTWYTATYSSTTHVWTYGWGSPTTHRVWVKATDLAGNTTTINRDVNVSTVTVTYVKPSGSDTNNGASWEYAEATVTSALSAATSGTEIWVAQGTYYERITLKSGVALYGGFAAAETCREQRNWAANKTALDGGEAGSVVTALYPVTSATIDGFTIAHGRNLYYGGGVYCSSASLTTIANNIIRGNSAGNYYGGGLYAYDSTLTVVGNVFVENNAGQGGGIFYLYSSGQIANNTIICNTASYGGGIYLDSTSPTLTNNIVAFNTGGGIYKSGGSATFEKNDVFGNSGYEYGGILTHPETDLEPADPVIPNIAAGDWHIAGNSPCKDAGASVSGLPDKDIDAGSRVYGGTVDIGADEWNGTDPTPGTPAVIYVKPDGNDNNNGTSWDNAVASVQTGIDLAYSAGCSEVWVAAGSYGRAGLKSFVHIYGGFAVGDTSKSARNWETNLTVLDGAAGGSVVTIDTVLGCQVDGFTIRNGSGTGHGGGIYCLNASATIADNHITGNSASNGGGIYCSGATGTIANNTIVGNSASRYGGGIYCTASSPVIRQNIIQSNTATDEGGGMFCMSGSCPLVSRNRFIDNDGADHGGAIALETDTTKPLIVNNLFTGNHVAGTGGGAINALNAVPWIINNTFVGNWAVAANGWTGDGGAVILRGAPGAPLSGVTVYNNIFYNNHAAGAGQSVYADEYCETQAIAFCAAWNPTGPNDAVTHYTNAGGTVIAGVDAGSSVYADPLFVDTTDYRLKFLPPNDVSPCIDKGVNPGSPPYDKVPVVDSDGNVRPVDIPGVANYGTNAFCDMGAYEVQE